MELPPIALACLAATLPAVAQHVTWAEGPSATALTVREADLAAGTARTVLGGCTLLPFDVSNRTVQGSLRADVARLVERQGLRRVVLPGGGALFRYARDGGRRHGFLHVRGDGSAQVVLELDGAGASGTASPFLDPIGVAPDGRHAAVPFVTGSLWLMRLDGGTYASTGGPARPLLLLDEVETTSLCVGVQHVFFATENDRVWRCALADGNRPVDVTPSVGGSEVRVKSEFAPAADGRSVVFLYGPKDLWSLYFLGETGPALRLPPPPAKYEDPGYLPESGTGPELLLADDGTRLMYIDSTVRDETYVLDTTGATATTHVTGDANFEPYIGIVVFPVAIGGGIVTGIGDPDAFDLYSASTGAPLVRNLTMSGGNTTRPFAAGALVPKALAVTGDGRVLAEVEPSSGGGARVWRFDAGGVVELATRTSGLSRSEGSVADWRIRSAAGDVLLETDGEVLLAAPPGVRLSTAVGAPGGAFRAFYAEAGTVRGLILRWADGSLFGLPATAANDELCVAGPARLVVDGPELVVFDPSGVRRLAGAAAVRHVLSGAGVSE